MQVVEKLYRLKWGKPDGLGALVISPTRELAMQIFDELRKVGAKHDLSAGLLIGGKNVREEQGRVNGALPSLQPTGLNVKKESIQNRWPSTLTHAHFTRHLPSVLRSR
jgi:hypothetical protein